MSRTTEVICGHWRSGSGGSKRRRISRRKGKSCGKYWIQRKNMTATSRGRHRFTYRSVGERCGCWRGRHA
eukprot:11245191-Prorocentrum_lima.AAC.1